MSVCVLVSEERETFFLFFFSFPFLFSRYHRVAHLFVYMKAWMNVKEYIILSVCLYFIFWYVYSCKRVDLSGSFVVVCFNRHCCYYYRCLLLSCTVLEEWSNVEMDSINVMIPLLLRRSQKWFKVALTA